MPVLEEARTMLCVTDHNKITMAMSIFKALKEPRWRPHAGNIGEKIFALIWLFFFDFLCQIILGFQVTSEAFPNLGVRHVGAPSKSRYLTNKEA